MIKKLGGYMRKLIFICLLFMMILPVMLTAQMQGNLAGKISDEDGNALESASIMIPALELGTYSRANGSFYLQNVPAGEHEIQVRLMGHTNAKATVTVRDNETTVQNFSLQSQAMEVEGFSVNATRAIERKTPVSFSNVDAETIQQKYTTGDMPQMLDDIPGLFSTTSGLGEAEITMRGFDANKIQILINGIPVNDPESQVVYWSNWTGLASNVKNVQVQRGAGASLYGSGAFGGSVNIETMGTETRQHFSLRTSGGFYTTDGKSANSYGEMEDYSPFNYNIQLKYSSGKLFNNKFRYDITAERKAGDYYIRGTEYDGWSFGFETENKVGTHVINSSFIVSPQAHNQARSTYDRELGKFLGREFNFTNHPWQENTYVKPQLSFRDKWTISPETNVMTNLFFTTGEGGGSYANNIIFDAESGALLYQPLNSVDVERRNFARHAFKVYQETGHLIEGMEIIDHGAYQEGQFTWEGDTETVYSGSDFYTNQHTWKYKSYNNHQQFGLNSYFDHQFNDYFNLVLGAESRYWKADHYKEGSDFRYYQPSDPDSVSTLGSFVRDYDYTTDVLNTSGFVRSKIEIPVDSWIQNINLMLDGQYAVYYSGVDENPLYYYDFMADEFVGDGFYATKQDSILVWQHNAAGDSTQVLASKFSDDDYNRTFEFFSPKMGVNVNLNDNWNVLGNYSIVYKEPRVRDWYNREEGPGSDQFINGKQRELVPEKGLTFEVGTGYRNDYIQSDLTYYRTKFTDKIENASIGQGEQIQSATLNVGSSIHQGVEFSIKGEYENFDANATTTISRNRWDDLSDLDVQQIFYESAEDVEGKVVPYSPEQMASASIGYTFEEMPLMGSLRLGLSGKWSDEYYSTYDNVYVKQEYYYDEDGNFQSMGEHEFVENAENAGAYDYDPATESYIKNFSGTGAYDREWIYSSSKLPTFFELNGSISYKFYLGSHETSIKLNINNILNKKDNFSKAYITRAFGMKLKREDEDGNVSWDDPTFGEGAAGGNSEGGGYYPYLSPTPLLNVFLTMEIKF
jgi:outer membrane receptor protein involved in Fe transport